MKRTLLMLSAAILAFCALAGCTAGKPEPGAEAPTAAPAATEAPSAEHTAGPTAEPTGEPAAEPTAGPTETPYVKPTFAPVEEYSLPEDPDDLGDCIRDAEVLFNMPWELLPEVFSPWSDEGSAGFVMQSDALGPESFCVADGKVYLADTLKNRIIISDNGSISSFPTYDMPSRMCVIGGVIYTSPTLGMGGRPPLIVAYDQEGNELERIYAPEEVGSVKYLFEYEGKLAMLISGGELYRLKDGEWRVVDECGVRRLNEYDPDGRYVFELKGKSIVFSSEIGPNHACGWNDSAFYIALKTVKPDGPQDIAEYTYRVYDHEGSLLGLTCVDPRFAVLAPDNPVYIADDGSLYVMCWTPEGVCITKPHLRMEYTSHLTQ